MKEEYNVNIYISENSDIISINGPVEGVKKAQQVNIIETKLNFIDFRY